MAYTSRRILIILIAGSAIACIGFGIRASFGLFLNPMSEAHQWPREVYAFALAMQNLLWGLSLPLAGACMDKYGSSRVIIVGAILYALGIVGMANSHSASLLTLSAGVLTGLGIAFTSFSIAMTAMAKVVSAEKRSLAFGLGTAAGSLGQVIFSPLTQQLINAYGWQQALYLLAAISLSLIVFALLLPGSDKDAGQSDHEQTLKQAIGEAFAHRGFILLSLGFFVCGFHVAFITVHLPAYVRDLGLAPHVGAYCIAIIGLFNVAGSLLSGAAGQRFSKKNSLSFIYFTRSIVILILLLAPKTEITLYLFAAAMGILWLSTVPLTTGIVAQVFGMRYMATLYGFVFLSHQIGSFMGIWLGGRIYDQTGSYDQMWWLGIAVGLASAFIHLPINEAPLSRLSKASA